MNNHKNIVFLDRSAESMDILMKDIRRYKVLTDEEDVPDAMRKLKTVYPNVLRLDYDNVRTRSGAVVEAAPETEEKSPLALAEEFYALQNGRPMSGAQTEYLRRMIGTVCEDEA